MFADNDFLLALIKDTDWLKRKASKILEEHRGEIETSISVMIELALVCKRLKMNVLKAFTSIFVLVKVDSETYNACLKAAVYIEKHGLNVFDSFHAAYCYTDSIISSDKVYDKLGIKRIKLE